MKLNNRGMSLMELLVSIVLVGMVLSFLFQLLTDLRNETGNNNYAYNNQVNRTEAIYTIQKDLNTYTLTGIEDKSTDKLALSFYYIKGDEAKEAILWVDTFDTENIEGEDDIKYYLRYTNVEGEKYSWEMKGADIDQCGLFTYYVDSISNNYYFKLNIYLYNSIYHDRNNKDRNNAVDDIEITYAGNKSDLVRTNGIYLTNNTKGEKQIGSCAN